MIQEIQMQCKYEPDDEITFNHYPRFSETSPAAVYVAIQDGDEFCEAKLNREDVGNLIRFLEQWLEGTI